MKSVIITGATGMLGIALINRLVKDNIEIVALVRPNSPNIFNIQEHPNISVIECDLCNLKNLNFGEKKIDAFFHFGWEGTIGEGRNDSYCQNRNVQYTLDAVKMAKKLGCDTFIGAGSQAEYGRVSDLITSETVVDPENAYGISKYTAGKLSRIYAEQIGIKKHVWVRVFSVYGPFNVEKSMIMSMINRLLCKEKPMLSGGDQIWDYLYCDDAAEAFYLIAKKGVNKAVYCLGSGIACPLKDYFYVIRDAIDKRLPLGIGEVPYSQNQVMNLCADISRLTEDTGFVPKVSFKEGIKKTIDWCRKERCCEEN